ncbi:MAG: protein kinase [Polyangiaceae bacterium]
MTELNAGPVEGEVFQGKYRIEKIIGQGGMGSVYLAVHQALNQRVAIKVLLGEISSNPEAVSRFVNEAQAAARIQGEHVVRVTDVVEGHSGNPPYMVMEYLEGGDLAQLLEQRTFLPPHEAVDYVLQSLEAIHQAHEAKIVHRDLKPSNLFLARKSDGSTIIKVLDFGISKVTGGNQSGALTRTQSMLGSPLYMSPEQLRSSKSVDQRADIWAIGVILYELLTGTVPYNGESIGELFAAILEQDAPSLRERRPELDPRLDSVVMRCLQKKKEDRWDSVADLAVALAPFVAPGRQSQLAMRATQGLIRPASVPPAAYAGPYSAQMGPGTPQPGVQPGSMGHMATGQGAPPMRPAAPSYAGNTGSNSWSATDGGPPKKSPVGLIIGAAAGFLLLVGGGITGVVVLKKGPNAGGTAGTASAEVPTATPTLAATASAAPTIASPPPSATATAEPVASATGSAKKPGGPGPVAAVIPPKATATAKPVAVPVATPTNKPPTGLGGRGD